MDYAHAGRRRQRILYGRGELAVYLGVVLVSLALIVMPDSPRRRLASHIEDYALYPFRHAAQAIESAATAWEENRALAEELSELRLELLRVDDVRRENERLRAMLDLSRASELRLIGCEVLAEGGGRLGDRTLLIDRGARHGLRQGMPLTGATGVAGKVVEVYPEFARAILLTHKDSAVSVRVKRTRVAGIVEWDPGSGATLKLRGISYLADVAVGDTLVTSGLGGVYPSGLTVGWVGDLEPDATGLLRDVTVTPAVRFAELEEVFALEGDPPTPDATAGAKIPASHP